ncbi:MAG: histidine kinase dimerization/phosphoacceptor domain -containing protein [Alteromonadaceae bacterium]|jgi:two-component sensor histidine kinase
MCKSKSDELLLRISELDKQLTNAHIASEHFALQAETVANIAKMKEQALEVKIIGLEAKLDRTRGINRVQFKNVQSNYEELIATAEELDVANIDKGARAAELVIANKEKYARAAELVVANAQLFFDNDEKDARAAELVIAKEKLVSENKEKDARLVALDIANKEKDARAAELVIANKEKDARAAELVIAKEKLVSENKEKDARLVALNIANKEKDARAAELVIANKDKDARAAELVIAKEKLVSENKEKDARLAALDIANKDKDARAAELVIANKDKDARAVELESAGEKVKASLQEKEVLLKEIHHRVKNNLQVICSMLSLQARAEPDGASRKALEESQRRVKVMARIHESLHQSNNLMAVDAKDYINAIAADTIDSSQINSHKVETHVSVDKININIDTAIVCGQIFSELYSNCIKHAFPDGRSGSIEVGMRRANKGRIELKVVDDGIGLLKGFNIHQSATLGMKLVGALTTQINGEISIDGSSGTSVVITFEGKEL